MESAVRPPENVQVGSQIGYGEGVVLHDPAKGTAQSSAKASRSDNATELHVDTGMHFAVRRLVESMSKGAESDAAQSAVHALRKHVTENFFNCTVEAFRGLGELYIEDARFTSFFEKYHTGLAQFVKEAIDIYCDKISRDGE